MTFQDNFYLEKEADAFFDRWVTAQKTVAGSSLRESKKHILDCIERHVDLKHKNVLEIGCFVGDLLDFLRRDYTCDVYGIEPSAKACAYARQHFQLELENTTLAQSRLFNLSQETRHTFDLIICDDVLSWVSRDLILPCLGMLDWMLKPHGALFLRDFSPHFGFAYPNHHWPTEPIFNFKQPGGHRQFFLSTGQYLEQETHVRVTGQYQQVSTGRPDSAVWADSLLIKLPASLHPVEKLL